MLSTGSLGNRSDVGATAAVVAVTPVPDSITACGTPVAPVVVLLNVSVAARPPSAPGVNVTETKQNPPGGIVALQRSDSPKSVGFAPVIVAVNTSAVFPIFCRMRSCAGLVVPTAWRAKGRIVTFRGARVAAGFSPLPDRKARTDGTGSLLVTRMNEPLVKPAVVGVKVIPRLQLALGARLAPHVLVAMAKGAPGGEITMLVSGAVVLVFVNVIVCAALVVFTTWFEKFKNVGFNIA